MIQNCYLCLINNVRRGLKPNLGFGPNGSLLQSCLGNSFGRLCIFVSQALKGCCQNKDRGWEPPAVMKQ